MKEYALLFLFFFSATLMGQQEEVVSLDTGTHTLEGTFLLPETEGAVPVVLIIAGSGPTDRDGNNTLMKNNSLKFVAEGLAEQGIASLRYDKRGIGESSLTKEQMLATRFEDLVTDAKSWISYLQTRDDVSEIHVLGHSQGSLVGMMAARDTEVQRLISVAGIGVTVDVILREQLKAQAPVLQEQADIMLDSLAQGHEVKKIHPMLQAIFNPAIQPFLRSYMKYDPHKEIAKLEQAVLIVNGTTDLQVGVPQAENLKAGNPNAEMVIIENMNHVLKDAPADRNENLKTYYNPELPLSPDLLPAIVDFIKS